ncbi:MAG: glutaredoxin family protein [Acidobacteria bacterium]|nr:glutaredoxin family protein [Acidobacteriota bacterium]
MGVAFVEKNIREDPAALAELAQLGYRATPVTVIDGQVVIGFDRGKLMRLLGPQ